jgi:hypothetical protein
MLSMSASSAALNPRKVRATGIKVLAGSVDPGSVDGVGTQASLHLPQALIQPDADTLLIVDRANGRVRRFNLSTGTIHHIMLSLLLPSQPSHVSIVWLISGRMTTVAGRQTPDSELQYDDYTKPVNATDAHLHSPSSLCMDPVNIGHVLIGSDENQKCIRRLSPDGTCLVSLLFLIPCLFSRFYTYYFRHPYHGCWSSCSQ